MKRSADRSRSNRRGFALLEVMVAAGVFAIGMAGVFGMLQYVIGANRSVDLTNTANAAFTRLAAQIRDAQCDFDASNAAWAPAPDPLTTDPGLVNAVGRGWIGFLTPAIANSGITHVGETLPGNASGLEVTSPSLRIEYRVSLEAAPQLVGAGVLPTTRGPAFSVEVRIRQLTGDPAKDNPAVDNGLWIKHFMLSKACNARYERGGVNGRDS